MVGSTNTVTFSGSNTYTSGTFVDSGVLKLGSAFALNNVNTAAAGATVANGATLDVNGNNQMMGFTNKVIVISGTGAAGQNGRW